MKFIDFHNKSMKTGRLADHPAMPKTWDKISGLCDAFDNELTTTSETFDLFKPTQEDRDNLYYENLASFAWASGKSDPQWGVYTPLRQTIVLFCAAIEGQL